MPQVSFSIRDGCFLWTEELRSPSTTCFKPHSWSRSRDAAGAFHLALFPRPSSSRLPVERSVRLMTICTA